MTLQNEKFESDLFIGAPSRALVDKATEIMNMRRHRFRFFERDLFGEPGWDMLLALYIAKGSGYRLKVTDAMVESNASPTTALRWVTHIVNNGFAVRSKNPKDQRSLYLDITEKGQRLMTAFLTDDRLAFRP